MGICYKICAVLAIICLLENHTLGAPTKGRYMWVKCKPEGKDPNCHTQKGPWMNLPGPQDRLPASATKTIVPVESSEVASEEVELSGDGSGGGSIIPVLPELGSGDQWMADTQDQVEYQAEVPVSAHLGEESSGDFDYSNYIFPEKVKANGPSTEELKEENMLL
ncbi:serglycin [Chanos chanos]|uniref:Serglycin n=1 Tax=Chanos chanos TaxID=29144 RepID=A0A6J2V944_CHACN|nr:serglycin [Chanos chanos]